ncbi:MAG: hypothetical protein Q4B43_06305 [Bacteroidota bacterium]|nr:hypothetical protein [Bacteroidota bacterium]
MKKVLFIFILFVSTMGIAQVDSKVEQFAKEILLGGNVTKEKYMQYIKYYNNYEVGSPEFEEYFEMIKYYIEIRFIQNIVEKEFHFKDVTSSLSSISKFDFSLRGREADISKMIAVFMEDEFVTLIILDHKGDIISYFSGLIKARTYEVWYLDEEIE